MNYATNSVVIGPNAGANLDDGKLNIIIGDHCATNITKGDNNIIIGDNIQCLDEQVSNQLLINTGKVVLKIKMAPKVAEQLCMLLSKVIQNEQLISLEGVGLQEKGLTITKSY